MKGIQVDIYENGNLAVSHIFWGKTFKAAWGMEEVHRGTDSFYRAAMTTGDFKGIPLTIDVKKVIKHA